MYIFIIIHMYHDVSCIHYHTFVYQLQSCFCFGDATYPCSCSVREMKTFSSKSTKPLWLAKTLFWCLELGNLGNLECFHDVTTCSIFQCLPAANLGKSLSLSLSPFEQESIVSWSWLCVTAIRIAVAEIVVQAQREFGTEIKMKLHNIHCNLKVLNNLWKPPTRCDKPLGLRIPTSTMES
jgi:hypothetical protein